jgi:uncharacterized protein
MTNFINNTEAFVKQTLQGAEGGHDWWHILRVWNNAKLIAVGETGADHLVIELGALLHDIADAKFHGGNEDIGPQMARTFLEAQGLAEDKIAQVEYIIKNISYKQELDKNTPSSKSIELAIVQDADRLDAIGAIGIARCFNYGGYKNREIYNPTIPPNLQMTKEEYKHASTPTINHFYEKLLLLKDKMNTTTGRKIAEERHKYMQSFLTQFYAEWNGER